MWTNKTLYVPTQCSHTVSQQNPSRFDNPKEKCRSIACGAMVPQLNTHQATEIIISDVFRVPMDSNPKSAECENAACRNIFFKLFFRCGLFWIWDFCAEAHAIVHVSFFGIPNRCMCSGEKLTLSFFSILSKNNFDRRSEIGECVCVCVRRYFNEFE